MHLKRASKPLRSIEGKMTMTLMMVLRRFDAPETRTETSSRPGQKTISTTRKQKAQSKNDTPLPPTATAVAAAAAAAAAIYSHDDGEDDDGNNGIDGDSRVGTTTTMTDLTVVMINLT